MSDWGKIVLYYDYERVGRFTEQPEMVTGVISKGYKWINIPGMIAHAYNGIRYFKEHIDYPFYDINVRRVNEVSEIGNFWSEINTAFDILFETQEIDTGFDAVDYIIKNKVTGHDSVKDNLFQCEGSYGWLYISYTGNLNNGYQIKYGYMYGKNDDNWRVMSIMEVLDIYRERYAEDYLRIENDDYFKSILQFFEQETTLMTCKEFDDIEEQATKLFL